MKIDWESVTHIFQIPLRWFREIDRRSRIIPDGNTLRADTNNAEGTVLSIDKDALAIPSAETGTAANHTDSPEVYDSSGASWTWAKGGSDGFSIDAYYIVETSGSYHMLQRCRLTVSKDGLIVAAQGLSDRIRIKA